MKRILFLSALDFKDKSIQVIRETPLAYARRGWDVRYLTARDTSEFGDYAYEPVLDPAGIRVRRFDWPFRLVRDALIRRRSRLLLKLLLKLILLIVIVRLAARGWRELRRGPGFDIVYGYECHGVLAASLVRLLLCLTPGVSRPRFVSRFQGTKLTEALEQKRYFKLLGNFEHLLANWLPCDVCIMTNDGTRGKRLLTRIGARCRRILFYVNGLDGPTASSATANVDWRAMGISEDDRVFLTVSRLVSWKRLDRALRAFAAILAEAPSGQTAAQLKLVIVGGGNYQPQYERLARELALDGHIIFTGAVSHAMVPAFLQRADVFLSFYDLSNVGNPLLEAVQHHKIIFTLKNGDTGRWIRHGHNGFIFHPDDDQLPKQVAHAFWELETTPPLKARIHQGVCELANRKLWGWKARLDAEIDAVAALT